MQSLSMDTDDTNQLVKLQVCLRDIEAWMSCNFLLLNSEKNWLLVCPKNQILFLDGITLPFNNTVRNLGVISSAYVELPSFIWTLSLKLETSCLTIMLKNWFIDSSFLG